MRAPRGSGPVTDRPYPGLPAEGVPPSTRRQARFVAAARPWAGGGDSADKAYWLIGAGEPARQAPWLNDAS
jgi:hypothetical protein